jgi:hypothetical protein
MKRFALFLFFIIFTKAALAGISDTPRKSEFEKALKVIITTVAPQWPTADVERIVGAYEELPANKAIAIEPVYGKTWRAGHHDSADDARTLVLEACQLRYGKPCALMGVNEEIVSEGPMAPRDMPRLHYQGKFDLTQMPVVRAARKTAPDLLNYDQAPEPKVITIHPWGTIYVSRNSKTLKDAETSTLARCNEDPDRNGKDGGCFIYAINRDVVLSKRLMSAAKR